MLVAPPLGFSRVESGIYRSAYPAKKALNYIDNLSLKSMVCLCMCMYINMIINTYEHVYIHMYIYIYVYIYINI
jgi:hypothetical protein